MIAFAMLAATVALADTNKPVKLTGEMQVTFGSRTATAGLDTYALKLNFDGKAIIRGNIVSTPIQTGLLGVSRNASIAYEIEFDLINPRNPASTLNIGKLVGVVPISPDGVYDYRNDALKVLGYPMGRASGFESRYDGTTAGKPLVDRRSLFDRLQKEALSLTKTIGGKAMTISVTNYDRMVFLGHKMAAGPILSYPDATVNGRMIYDYQRTAWHFQDLNVIYAGEGGTIMMDRFSGSIRWVEKPKQGGIRLGEYQFDVRINEPMADMIVAAPAADESAYFQTDDLAKGVSGSMKYVDTLGGARVLSSKVGIDLTGSRVSPVQMMNLVKIVFFSAIVPMNNE